MDRAEIFSVVRSFWAAVIPSYPIQKHFLELRLFATPPMNHGSGRFVALR